MKKTIIICLIFILANVSSIFATSKARPGEVGYKRCLKNIRMLQGAVENYNMDFSTPIKDFNDESINLLIKNKYLESSPKKPCVPCKYLASGDLSDDGEIYCEFHGGTDKEKIKPSKQFEDVLAGVGNDQLIATDDEIYSQILIFLAYFVLFICFCKGIIDFIKFLYSPKKKIIDFK